MTGRRSSARGARGSRHRDRGSRAAAGRSGPARRVEPRGHSSPSGATGTTPTRRRCRRARPGAARRSRRASSPRRRTGSFPAQLSTSSAANASSCGRTAPSCSRVAEPKPGRSTAIARRPRAPSSRQQRPPGVGRVAPAVQEDDPRPAPVHLERPGGVPRDLDPVLDDGGIQGHPPSAVLDPGSTMFADERPREPPTSELAELDAPAEAAGDLWESLRADPASAPEHVALAAAECHGPAAAAWAGGARTCTPSPGRSWRRWPSSVTSSWRASRAPPPASAASSPWCRTSSASPGSSRGSCSSSPRPTGTTRHDPMRPAELLVLHELYPDPAEARRGARRHRPERGRGVGRRQDVARRGARPELGWSAGAPARSSRAG